MDKIKQGCIDFYNSWQGEKITFPSFYQQVRKNKEASMEELIQPKKKGIKKGSRRGSVPEEIERYERQPEPKANKVWFRSRLRAGYSKEEAILLGDEWMKARERMAKSKPICNKKYVPKYNIEKIIDIPRDYSINITYPKEVAQVFRKEYLRIIGDLEWELSQTEEKTLIGEVNKKLELTKKELQTFNSYNKI